jgi:hypothetical protein
VVDTCVRARASGNDCTNTSARLLSFETKATHRPSGENCPSVSRMTIGPRPPRRLAAVAAATKSEPLSGSRGATRYRRSRVHEQPDRTIYSRTAARLFPRSPLDGSGHAPKAAESKRTLAVGPRADGRRRAAVSDAAGQAAPGLDHPHIVVAGGLTKHDNRLPSGLSSAPRCSREPARRSRARRRPADSPTQLRRCMVPARQHAGVDANKAVSAAAESFAR